jgi:hypothetical protein
MGNLISKLTFSSKAMTEKVEEKMASPPFCHYANAQSEYKVFPLLPPPSSQFPSHYHPLLLPLPLPVLPLLIPSLPSFPLLPHSLPQANPRSAPPDSQRKRLPRRHLLLRRLLPPAPTTLPRRHQPHVSRFLPSGKGSGLGVYVSLPRDEDYC